MPRSVSTRPILSPGQIFCPVGRALDVIGDRWTLVLVRHLLGGPLGFQELRARSGIAPRVLSARLRALTKRGFVAARRIGRPPALRAQRARALAGADHHRHGALVPAPRARPSAGRPERLQRHLGALDPRVAALSAARGPRRGRRPHLRDPAQRPRRRRLDGAHRRRRLHGARGLRRARRRPLHRRRARLVRGGARHRRCEGRLPPRVDDQGRRARGDGFLLPPDRSRTEGFATAERTRGPQRDSAPSASEARGVPDDLICDDRRAGIRARRDARLRRRRDAARWRATTTRRRRSPTPFSPRRGSSASPRRSSRRPTAATARRARR